MNNIDKYIKLNFSLVKGELIGLACCTVFASSGLFASSLEPISLILIVAMVALFIKILTKICDKTLFGEGAVLYQSLPFSTDEIIVAKTFVITVATTICWSGIMTGLSMGLAFLKDEIASAILWLPLLELLDMIGAAGAPVIVLKLVANGFFVASMLFAVTVATKTTDSYISRVVIFACFIGLMGFSNEGLPDLINLITRGNYLLSAILQILFNVAMGICASFITKYCLDKKYILP